MDGKVNLFEILIPALKERLGEKCPDEAVLKDIIITTAETVTDICNKCIRSACVRDSLNTIECKINMFQNKKL